MKTSSLTVPIVELAKDFFSNKGVELLEKSLEGFDEIYIDNPEHGKFKTLDIKTKNGKLSKIDITFKNGDSLTWTKPKKEIQDALVFIEENK